MDSTTLDLIVATFLDAFAQGRLTLQSYSLPLLGALAILMFYTSLWPVVMSGAPLGDALATTLLTLIKIGVFYFLILYIYEIGIAGFETFLQWGLAVSGGGFGEASFRRPSGILDAGWRAAAPIQDLMQNFTGMGVIWNLPTILGYMVAYWTVIAAFAAMTLHLILTILEFHLALMVAPVLIPWGILTHTIFFAEFGIAWLTAGLLRVMLTAAVLSVAIPLFSLMAVRLTPGGDPTLYSAAVMAIVAVLFAWLAWTVGKRAAEVGGRGMALALGGHTLVSSGVTGWHAVRTAGSMVTGAVQSTSAMLAARRGRS